jgi:polyketide-type polyunsaturated fatty acid synthase PfaA
VQAPVAGGVDLAQIQKVMMQVVADKTGYPPEMLELGMDMEADLGIDSIKRVEILGAVQDSIPNLPELNPEDLAELRTLGQIVEYMQKKAGGSAAPVAKVQAAVVAPAAGGVDLAQIQKVMMQVVADKTGYPPEMLELGMDMEADLGIDSIKRVEILGAVQDSIPNLPELNPEDLAELRTLGQIVEYMQKKAGGSAAPVAKVQAAAAAILAPVKTAITSAVVDASTFARKLMAVVAEKTGYPVEMLELDMDMEADLGIDSIKRVEILGATQDSMPGLPEVEPEKLAEMRTLGQIVDVFSGMGSQGQVAVAGIAEKKSFEPAPSATVAIRSLPAPTPITPAKGGNCLLVDDGSAEAVLLAEKLLEDGFQVTALTPAWVSAAAKKSFSKSVKRAQLEAPVSDEKVKAAVAGAGALDMVVYLHSAPAISGIAYPENSSEGLKLAFLLAKHAQVKAATKARPTFAAVTRQGGKLGFGGNTNSDLVQGGLDGLVKTLAQEWPQVFCRLVDLADGVAAADAAAVLHAELFDAETALHEVGCDGKSRMTLVAVPTDSYAQAQGNRITADSVFLVSGGAKGVTTHCVARIASEYRCKFILLGRSAFSASEPAWSNGIADEAGLKKAAMQALSASGDKPTPAKVQQLVRPVLSDREIAAALAAIRSVGGQAEYVSADVTNAKAVKESVTSVAKKLGKITGIIHGAGVLADKFIEQKTLDDFNAVYRTKIDGLVALLGCVEQDQLQQLVLFSSAAGFYGNPGQSDYSIANEILNKTALRFKAQHPAAQVLSFNWGPWDGGMVTPELKRMFAQRGVYIIPLDAGAELLLQEMGAAENRCPQILVGNEMSGSEGVSPEGTPAKKPEAGRVIRALHAANNPFLADHVIGGNRVLPTVCAIAVMAEAAESLYPGYHYQGLAGYRLFKGVVFDGNEPASYLIDLKLLEESSNQIRVEAKVSSAVAGKTVFHYGASLLLIRESLAQPAFSGKRGEGSIKAAADFYRNGTLFHGESLQGLTNLISCDAKGLQLACRVPSAAAAKQGDFPVGARNIFADDLVFQSLLVWVREQQGLGSLPSSTASWTLYREPAIGEEFLLLLTVVEDSPSKLLADVVLVDDKGRLLAEVRSAEVTKSASLNDLFLATGKRGA